MVSSGQARWRRRVILVVSISWLCWVVSGATTVREAMLYMAAWFLGYGLGRFDGVLA